MPLSAALLDLLRCPLTGQRLVKADDEQVKLLERKRAGGALAFPAENPQVSLEIPIHAALVTEDGRYAYLIDDGLPILLPDHALSL